MTYSTSTPTHTIKVQHTYKVTHSDMQRPSVNVHEHTCMYTHIHRPYICTLQFFTCTHVCACTRMHQSSNSRSYFTPLQARMATEILLAPRSPVSGAPILCDLPTVGRRLSFLLSICQQSVVVCQFCCRFANTRPSSVSSVVDLPTVGRRLSVLLSIWQTGGEVEMGFHGR